MAPSTSPQLSIESTSPTALSVGLPDGFDAALCQNEYLQYTTLSSGVLINTVPFKLRMVDLPAPDIDRRVYKKRLKALEEAAKEEGIEPIGTSLDEFFKFINIAPFRIRTAALFLSDDGSYAAIWRDEKWRLNIKFPGDDVVEYVLLDRAVNSPEGMVGSATFEEFNKLITDKDLKPLLQA